MSQSDETGNNDKDVTSKGTNSQSSVYKSVSVDHGMNTLDRTIRSVLSHPFCLSLVYFIHKAEEQNGINPLPFDLRRSRSDVINMFTHKYDSIIAIAWNESFQKMNKVLKSTLTSTITLLVNDMQEQKQITLPFLATSQKEVQFDNVNEKIDIVLESTRNDSTKIPYMIFEFGMDHDQWWSKFNQGVKYVEMIYKQSLQNDTPLLMVIVTIDPKSGTSNNNNSTDNTDNNDKTVETKMGLFFCRPRWTGEGFKGLRISLIWNSNSEKLLKGSQQLGKVFEVATLFKSCLEDIDQKDLYRDYEYFSSNCCRIGDKVCF
jgi:hypothetical protein